MNSIAMIFKNGLNCIGKFVHKNQNKIMIGAGLGGFGTSLYLMAKQAPKAKEALIDLYSDLANSDEDLSKPRIFWEEVKTVTPYYAAPVLTAIGSGTLIVCGVNDICKEKALWVSAYEGLQAKMVERIEAEREVIGEKKEKEIDHYIEQKKMDDEDPQKSSEVVITDGKSLFKFDYNGRYFRSTRDEIINASKTIYERLVTEMWIPFNEFQYELGLSDTGDGENNGFCIDYGIDVRFVPGTAPDGRSCQVVKFGIDPIPDKTKC